MTKNDNIATSSERRPAGWSLSGVVVVGLGLLIVDLRLRVIVQRLGRDHGGRVVRNRSKGLHLANLSGEWSANSTTQPTHLDMNTVKFLVTDGHAGANPAAPAAVERQGRAFSRATNASE